MTAILTYLFIGLGFSIGIFLAAKYDEEIMKTLEEEKVDDVYLDNIMLIHTAIIAFWLPLLISAVLLALKK